ncbi:hypothetical protein BC828DRAFT_402282 [Blastocladiella britannica]|nr:hypothetical protein BC828DRAFT_402282 [Blastocladiella britannica]
MVQQSATPDGLRHHNDHSGPAPLINVVGVPSSFVLLPGTPLLTAVRIAAFVAGYWAMILAPIRIAFGTSLFTPTIELVVDFLLLFVLSLDIVCRFFAAHFNESAQLVVNLQSIRWHYFTHEFPLRVLAMIPFCDLRRLTGVTESIAVDILSLLPLLHLLRWVFLAIEKESSLRNTKAFTLLILLLIGVQIVHWLTCFWWYLEIVCVHFYSKEHTWATTFAAVNLWDEPVFHAHPLARYIYVFQFVMTTILDSVDRSRLANDAEVVFGHIVSSIGSVMVKGYMVIAVAYLTNQIAAKSRTEYHINSCVQYLRSQGLSPAACHRYAEYHKHLWLTQNGTSRPWTLFNDIPDSIRSEIALGITGTMLRGVSIFASCSEPLMRYLASKVDQVYFAPGEAIIRKDDVGAEMYIVRKGTAQVVSDDHTRVWAEFSEGGFFGELSIFTPIKRTATVVAVSRCHLLRISRKDLQQVQVAFPEEAAAIRAQVEQRLAAVTQRHEELRQSKHKTAPLQYRPVSLAEPPSSAPQPIPSPPHGTAPVIVNSAAMFVPAEQGPRRRSSAALSHGPARNPASVASVITYRRLPSRLAHEPPPPLPEEEPFSAAVSVIEDLDVQQPRPPLTAKYITSSISLSSGSTAFAAPTVPIWRLTVWDANHPPATIVSAPIPPPPPPPPSGPIQPLRSQPGLE